MLKTDLSYCTIKLRQCQKQQDCKRWIANYSNEEQNKALYDGNVWFTDGKVCANSGYELYINKDKE